ncbi:MAG: hypothetical protein MK105_07645 [Crocinitomicaceae bacterium]|nr:hypothetical protein [Crocinitomicaceae bacterium]
MKTILSIAFILTAFVSISQELKITQCNLQDLGNQTGILTITFKGEVVNEFKEVKISIDGERVANNEFTFVASNAKYSGKNNAVITLTGKVKLSNYSGTNTNITYKIMDNGINGFRALKPGQVTYLPPIEKK